jgi:hypothetical protein
MNQRSDIRVRPWRGPGATISALQAWTRRGCRPLRAVGRVCSDGRHPGSVAGVRPLLPLRGTWRDAPARSLGGHGADGEREAAPRGQPRKDRGQVQDDPAHGALDPDGELDQPLAQRGDLGVGAGRPARVPLQRLVQHIRRHGQQDAELVGRNRGQLVRSRPSPSFSCPSPKRRPPCWSNLSGSSDFRRTVHGEPW